MVYIIDWENFSNKKLKHSSVANSNKKVLEVFDQILMRLEDFQEGRKEKLI